MATILGSTPTPAQTTTLLALTFIQGGAYGTFGTFGNDLDGSCLEVGYGMEMSGMDLGIAIISANSDLSVIDENNDENNDAEISMMMKLSKSFDLK